MPTLFTFRRAALAAAFLLPSTFASAAQFPGGFLESPTSADSRPLLSKTEIQNLLPQRGKFTFPSPYNTEGVRLTNASDCGGADCVNYVGYSYWRNMNNHVGSDKILFFLGLNKDKGGTGPTLFEYNKKTDEVNNLGPLFDSSSSHSWASAEGWYFSATMPYKLYMHSGSRILRYDVKTEQMETVFDVNSELGSGHMLWQLSSSDNDRVHIGTVKDSSTYKNLGCMAYEEDSGKFHFFKPKGLFDECQIDKSGKWLVIKENVDGLNGEDNRIINLETGQERVLLDEHGAAGHSDLGHGYMIAQDNFHNEANIWKLWDFESSTLQGTGQYYNMDWSVAAPAHVSHTNAVPGVAPEDQYSCGSSSNRNNSAHSNEIICFMMDGSYQTLVVAPVMTDMNSGSGDSYSKMPKGNLDVTGQYFIWTSNMGGERTDAFLVKVPSHKLNDGSVAPAPTDPIDDGNDSIDDGNDSIDDGNDSIDDGSDPIDDGSGTTGNISWMDMVNVSTSGGKLIKSSGCDGCADAGAASEQTITDGNGYLEFTVTSEDRLRTAGLTGKHAATGDSEIDYGLRVQGTMAEVRENGTYRYDTTVASGDILRIAVYEGTVTYSRNGKVFYTSDKTASGTLRVDTTFYSLNASLSGMTLGDSADSGGDGGSGDDGSNDDGSNDDGSNDDGSNDDGSNDDGSNDDGSNDDGSNDDGSNDDGSNDDGSGKVNEPTPDTTAPVISDVSIENVTTSSVTIKWTTDEPAESRIQYGVTGGLGNATPIKNTLSTSHAVTIDGVDPCTRYFFQIQVRDAEGNIGESKKDKFHTEALTLAAPQPVTWTNKVNVSGGSDGLRKTAGCDGCSDAGANSVESITGGQGYVEFTVNVEDRLRMIGLSQDIGGTGADTIDFGLRLQGGAMEVRENGRYHADTAIRQGDLIRIAVDNGTVRYSRNGKVFYTSPTRAGSKLYVDTTLYSRDATLNPPHMVRGQ